MGRLSYATHFQCLITELTFLAVGLHLPEDVLFGELCFILYVIWVHHLSHLSVEPTFVALIIKVHWALGHLSLVLRFQHLVSFISRHRSLIVRLLDHLLSFLFKRIDLLLNLVCIIDQDHLLVYLLSLRILSSFTVHYLYPGGIGFLRWVIELLLGWICPISIPLSVDSLSLRSVPVTVLLSLDFIVSQMVVEFKWLLS